MPRPNHPIPHPPHFHLMPACRQCAAQMKIIRVTPMEEGLEAPLFVPIARHEALPAPGRELRHAAEPVRIEFGALVVSEEVLA